MAGAAGSLLLWTIPGRLLQLSGGSRRQLGARRSTGLLIANPLAGWRVLAGIAVRFMWARVLARPAGALEVVAAGCIAGDAPWLFGDAVMTPRARGGA